jgi:hypothetical protein
MSGDTSFSRLFFLQTGHWIYEISDQINKNEFINLMVDLKICCIDEFVVVCLIDFIHSTRNHPL